MELPLSFLTTPGPSAHTRWTLCCSLFASPSFLLQHFGARFSFGSEYPFSHPFLGQLLVFQDSAWVSSFGMSSPAHEVRQSFSLWILTTLATTLYCGSQHTVTPLPPVSPTRLTYLCIHDYNQPLRWSRHIVDGQYSVMFAECIFVDKGKIISL